MDATGRSQPRTRWAGALVMTSVVLGLATVSCGGDEGEATSSSAPKPTEATTDSRATTSPDTSSPATTSNTGPTTSILEGVTGDGLPDGDQVGYLSAVDLGTGTVTVDLAELLTGDPAVQAYLSDTGRPLDGEQFYVRNRDPRLRTVALDPSGTYGIIFAATCCGPTSVTTAGLAEAVGGDWQGVTEANPPFNLSVVDGVVTAAVQMYRP